MTARFRSADESHAHSLETLETLYEFDDFMQSVKTLVDMGCGSGLDLAWWASRTTRDINPRALNISCQGVDLMPSLSMAQKHNNITYRSQDFECSLPPQKRKFDVIWCHDSFQYVINPFHTLQLWKTMLSPEGTMILVVPQSTNLEFNRQAYDQIDGVYWNWTVVGLMHVLAVSGWNCSNAYFRKDADDPWIHVLLHNSADRPRDPKTARWYELAEAGMLPESAVNSINKHGYLRQRDLVLTWVDGTKTSLANI
jgi:SAM-dependent methyltransferase